LNEIWRAFLILKGLSFDIRSNLPSCTEGTSQKS